MKSEGLETYQVAAGSPLTDGTAMEQAIARAVRTGDHLWVLTAAWRADPAKGAGGVTLMDHENLLTIGGPGCFVCEKDYTPQLALRRCTGEPRRRSR